MIKKPELYRKRISNYLETVIAPAIYEDSEPLTISVSQCADPIAYLEAVDRSFEPVAIGFRFGPKWSTAWFKIEGTVPDRFSGKKVVLRFNSDTEALLYRDGQPVQGMELNHDDYVLFHQARGGERLTLYVECGINRMFGADGGSRYDSREPMCGESAPAALKLCTLSTVNESVRALYFDIAFLADMEVQLASRPIVVSDSSPNISQKLYPTTSPRAAQILRVLNDAINVIDPGNVPGTAFGAREILSEALSAPAAHSSTNVFATGHAHLDLAWLWPVRETIRKAARTYATQLMLMDEYPTYIFHGSQAQLYAWMKEHQPALYERVREKVRKRQWDAGGAMWVEADCNIPSGESLVRQILHGASFWRKEFGIEQSYLWLPDVFGYSAALPQIMRQSGLRFFVTQKISWNEFNRFPHHTFRWIGIDGSSVLTHFLPTDTYNGDNSPGELLRGEGRLLEPDRAPVWLQAFGFGDGGGGPTRQQIEFLKRAENIDGLPRARFARVDDFLNELDRVSLDLPEWVGELYLEYHRGTYTTQARCKLYNRLTELTLREAELWSILSPDPDFNYPQAELERLWQSTLLLQFHDIIPGSSIRWVYEDAYEMYEQILKEAAALKEAARKSWLPYLDTTGARCPLVVFNSLSSTGSGLISIAEGSLTPLSEARPRSLKNRRGQIVSAVQRVDTAGGAVFLTRATDVAALGASTFSFEPDQPPASLKRQAARASFQQGLAILENRLLRAEFDRAGRLVRLLDKRTRREVVDRSNPANQFVLYEDRPNEYDAWNVDVFYSEKATLIDDVCDIKLVEDGPVRAAIETRRSFGRGSQMFQRLVLCAESGRLDFETEIDWQEEHQLLRVLNPVDILSRRATFEIQFGHVERSTHTNTSWDVASFEVVAHRWADLSEPGYGVAVLNDCKYGHSVKGNVLALSLLRAARWPDPEADKGKHRFTYSLMPHSGDLRQSGVIDEAHRLNSPLVALGDGVHKGALGKSYSSFSLDCDNIIIDTVKRAHESDAIVVRLLESHGRRNEATLSVNFPFQSCQAVDLLERPSDAFEVKREGDKIRLKFTPFAIRTLLLRRS